MKTFFISIPAKLISKSNDKSRNRFGTYYKAEKFSSFEKMIRNAAAKQIEQNKNFKMFQKDIVGILIIYWRNKTHCDLGNASKSVFDALQGIVYKNDKQFKEIVQKRIYIDEEPFFEISIIGDED